MGASGHGYKVQIIEFTPSCALSQIHSFLIGSYFVQTGVIVKLFALTCLKNTSGQLQTWRGFFFRPKLPTCLREINTDDRNNADGAHRRGYSVLFAKMPSSHFLALPLRQCDTGMESECAHM